MEELKSLMPQVLRAAFEAGGKIMEVYGSDFAVDFKADQSPLTLADQKAHTVIAQALAPLGYPLLSEEGKAVPYAERKTWDPFWMVDPLDGTKEFVKKNGEFTVNIALVRSGRPVLGVVYAPALKELYFAAEGLGAYQKKSAGSWDGDWTGLLNSSRLLKVNPLPSPGGLLRVVASRSHASPETEDCLSRWAAKYKMELVSSGSSLKFCRVAEGKADIYPRFAPTMEWDTAAGQAVLEEAGGVVWKKEDGQPLTYNKENLLNPWFLAGNRELLSGQDQP